MIRMLIVPAALLALSACAGSPTEPAARTGALRANPAFGSGAGLLPPADKASGQLGSGAVASTGQFGSGLAETGDVTLASGIMGSDSRTEPPADAEGDGSSIIGTGAKTADSDGPAMGSGNLAEGGYLGSGNLEAAPADATQETSDNPQIGSGAKSDGPQLGSGAHADGGYGMGSGN